MATAKRNATSTSNLRANNKTPMGDKNSSRGAVQSKNSIKDRLQSYWAHHQSSIVDSLNRMLAAPIQSLMTATVVGIALALPVTLLLALENFSAVGKTWDANPKIAIYLKVQAQQVAIDQLLKTVSALPDVESIEYLSPKDALEDFQRFSGFASVLDALETNPLPPTVIVTPKKAAMDTKRLQALSERIKSEALVQSVNVDLDWVKRLQEIMRLGEKIVLALATLLSLGVLLAIGNTIRLAIENRRDEILVSKLVGGTDSFVRRPFLYTGAWYGVFGGVIACIIVAISYASIAPTVQRLADLYRSDFSLHGLNLGVILRLLGISILLGWLGAWLAVGRHLSEIEPK